MNQKFALAAIAMFAVIMGIGMVAPAVAAPGNDKSKATTEICHYAETEFEIDPETGEVVTDPVTGEPVVAEEAHWMFLFLNNNGAVNGHIGNHGDGETTDFEIVDDDTRDQCDALVNPEPEPEPAP